MKWSDIFSRGASTSKRNSTHLDVQLVKRVRSRSIPAWRQFKYIKNFLSPTERRTITGLFVVVMAMTAVLCGGFISRHVQVVAATGGTYTEGLVGQPKYINPIFSSVNDVDADLVSLIYTGLFHYTPAGTLEPYLAESYSTSSDGTVYTVHLKPNTKWSDGEPITTDDVLYTIETIQNPDVGSPLFATFQGVKVERVDDTTISFTLKTPFAFFLNSLTVGILPAHIWSDYSAASIRLAKANLQPVGSGPWEFSRLAKDGSGVIQTFTLAPNTHFFGTKPYLQSLQFHFFNDYPPVIEALRNQQVSAASFIPQGGTSRLTNRSIKTYSLLLPQYTALFFNSQQLPALKDDSVRLALAQSIDKNMITSGVLGGSAMTIDSPVAPESIDYSTSSKKITFSPGEAVTALDKSWNRLTPDEYFKLRHDSLLTDYTNSLPTSTDADPAATTSSIESQISETIRQEMNADQPYYRADKNNAVLHITITTADTPEYVKVANAIAAAWRKVGIISAVQVVNSRQINRTVLHDRNYQVLLYGEIVGLDPDLFPFWHSSQASYPGLNLAQLSDRSADKLLEDARTTIDPAARAALYHKFQNILADELPAIFLYRPVYTFAASGDMHGVNFGTLNTPPDRYATLSSWYIKTKWEWR